MTRLSLTLAAATGLDGLALGVGSATAAPMGPGGVQTEAPAYTQVRMTHRERMMHRKMMKRKMMKRKMMMNRM